MGWEIDWSGLWERAKSCVLGSQWIMLTTSNTIKDNRNVISRPVGKKTEHDCLIKGNREWGQSSKLLFT